MKGLKNVVFVCGWCLYVSLSEPPDVFVSVLVEVPNLDFLYSLSVETKLGLQLRSSHVL